MVANIHGQSFAEYFEAGQRARRTQHSQPGSAGPMSCGGSSGAAGTCQVDRAADVNGVIDEPLQGCLHIGLHGIAW